MVEFNCTSTRLVWAERDQTQIKFHCTFIVNPKVNKRPWRRRLPLSDQWPSGVINRVRPSQVDNSYLNIVVFEAKILVLRCLEDRKESLGLGLEVPRGQKRKSWSWGASNVLDLKQHGLSSGTATSMVVLPLPERTDRTSKHFALFSQN